VADVFISYARRDSEFVGGLVQGLEGRGKDIWVDVEGIRDAEAFPAALRRAIEGSDAFVFVISPDSVASDFCEHEVAHAAELNKRIVPLALREVPDEQIPDEIRFRNWIPVRADGGAAVERVITAIETDLDWERQHTRLTVKSLEWDDSGRDPSFLLRGSDLAAAERWLAEGAGKDPGPTELEQTYLLAGRQAAGRRQRTLVGASLLVAVVAIGLLIFALISRGQAVTAKADAQAQALAAVSVTQQAVDPERAVLLGMAAVQQKATYGPLGTMFALRAALDASTIRYRLPPNPVQSCSSAPGSGPWMSYDPRPGSNVLAEGLCDGTVLLADAATGRVEHRVHLPGALAITVRYTRNGSALIVLAGTHVLALDPVTGAVRREAPFVAGVLGIAVDPRAPVVAIAARRELDFWNLADGRLTVTRSRTISELAAVANYFQYTPDGSELAVTVGPGNASSPGLILYDIASRRIVATRPESASLIAFSPNGRELALGGGNLNGSGRIVMLDARTLRVDPRFASIFAPDVSPSALAFSPDGTQLAYGFADGTAGLVSAANGRPIQSYLGDTAVINAVSFTPDGKLAATASSDGAVRAFRAGGLALSHVPAADQGLGPALTVEANAEGFVSLGIAPGHGVLVQRWADDGRALAAPLVIPRTAAVIAAFLSPGGRFAGVLPPANGPSASLELFDTSERRVVRTVRLAALPNRVPVLSADAKFAVTSMPRPTGGPNSLPQLVVVNLRTGSARVLPANAAGCTSFWDGFAFSSDDRYVAAGTFCGRVLVWDLATGRQVGHTLDLGGQLAFTAFSPDGKRLAIASWDGTIKISPVPLTGQAATLTENTKGVPQVSWSPDGRYLASAGLDHTVRIFDARSLNELRVIAQPEAVSGIAFTADSRDVISSSGDNNAWIWDACTDCESPSQLLALARSRVTRTLTAEERAAFGLG
jgi:WD40 repeat protein